MKLYFWRRSFRPPHYAELTCWDIPLYLIHFELPQKSPIPDPRE